MATLAKILLQANLIIVEGESESLDSLTMRLLSKVPHSINQRQDSDCAIIIWMLWIPSNVCRSLFGVTDTSEISSLDWKLTIISVQIVRVSTCCTRLQNRILDTERLISKASTFLRRQQVVQC
jgi:hypothetical protein